MDESSPVVNLPGDPEPSTPRGSMTLAYARLLRVPNVFTAIADILQGFLFTHISFQPFPTLLTLMAASCLMYLAGMVLNDVYDLEVDAIERPERPLPSGQIPVERAHFLGLAMLFAGVLAGVGVGAATGNLRPAIVATALALLVFAYDRTLKKTPLGPLAMGGCRTLNVLLGMSALSGDWGAEHYVIACGLGTYIAGVTWFAKNEAEESSQSALLAATCIVLAGIALVAIYPVLIFEDVHRRLWQWYLMLGVVAFFVGRRLIEAIFDPSPRRVQMAVKNCLFSLVVLNAAVVVVVCPPIFGAAILVLLAPAMLLGRWVYST